MKYFAYFLEKRKTVTGLEYCYLDAKGMVSDGCQKKKGMVSDVRRMYFG